MVTGDWNTIAPARSFNALIARNSDDGGFAGGENNPQWGGIHPGVVNFLIGDGAVRSISSTIPTGPLYKPDNRTPDDPLDTTDPKNELQPSILARLGYANSGKTVALP